MNIIITKINKDKIIVYNNKFEYKIYYTLENIKISGISIKIEYKYIRKYNNLYYIYFDSFNNENILELDDYMKSKFKNLQLVRNNITSFFIICNNFKNIDISNYDKYMYVSINKIKKVKNNNISIINII